MTRYQNNSNTQTVIETNKQTKTNELTLQLQACLVTIYTSGTISIGAAAPVVGSRTVAYQVNGFHLEIFFAAGTHNLESFFGLGNSSGIVATTRAAPSMGKQ